MTPSLALAAVTTGTLLTLAPINSQAVRDALRAITPDAPIEQAPDVAADLDIIDRITAWLPHWQQAGVQALERNLASLSRAEDRLLAAHGCPVPTESQRYAARQAKARAEQAIYDAAEAAHPASECPNCRAWEDCPATDKALRDAVHEDWVHRWNIAV